MTRRVRGLSREDRQLWSKVARSVAPMPGKSFPEEMEEGLASDEAKASPALPPVIADAKHQACLLYTSPSPRDA